jgi:hypothetical protein
MISMDPHEVTRRLRKASDASDLTTDRLSTKIDMSPNAVTARLKEASDLYEACLALEARSLAKAPR